MVWPINFAGLPLRNEHVRTRLEASQFILVNTKENLPQRHRLSLVDVISDFTHWLDERRESSRKLARVFRRSPRVSKSPEIDTVGGARSGRRW